MNDAAEPISPSKKNALQWIVLTTIFFGALFLYTRNNAFPFTYHPDEDTKVRQIVTGKRNFFHPLLMLTTTDAVMRLGLIPKTPMNAALSGRWVAAFFSAMAVCALALLAWRWTGPPGGVAVALLTMLNPLVFELAHYFKEDPALLVGLAISFLALDIFWKTPTRGSAIFLGLGCALAISGKYLGVVILLFALPPLFLHCRSGGWKLAGWFAAGLLVPLVLINLPLLLDLPDFRKGLSREMEGATGGHHGLGRDIPHAYYFGRLLELTPPGLWIGWLVALAVLLWKAREWSLAQGLTFAFPVFFLALLSFSPKTAGRYLLPVETFVAFLAGALVMNLGGTSWKTRLPVLALCGLLVWSTANACLGYEKEFSQDARTDLRSWIETHPSAAFIAQDGRVDLTALTDWKAPQVLTSEYVADLGTLDELRKMGVTHVAVARQTYNRYFNENLKPKPREKAEFERRSLFYQQLFATGKPVWESPLGKVVYLHPGLRLYDIRGR